jgi:glycosyltransferase involved in cell wall biosynthesis
MIYGAGMKGKIGGAIAAGVPVVTTSIGAEGFPFRNGKECFIADSPEEFVEKCNQCLEDPVLWHNFSVKSRLVMAENFSPSAVARKLQKIFINNTNSTTLTG